MDILTSLVFQLPRSSRLALRDQICEQVSAAISCGTLPPNVRLPSCRELAEQLNVSRSTVFAAYTKLVDLGLLEVRDRSGYRVRKARLPIVVGTGHDEGSAQETRSISFGQLAPSKLPRVNHPRDWSSYLYPFVYNQTDPKLFPIAAWRECSRQALNRSTLTEWVGEFVEGDNPHLLRQLRQRLLIHRGVVASDDEIMVTLGAQNALAIMGLLFSKERGAIAVEDPGFPDARNAFIISGNEIVGVGVDDDGLIAQKIPSACKLVFTTPGHQFPTSVTMSMQRRQELIERARRCDFFILEDDYEAEMCGKPNVSPPLRSLDREDRVIYIGSLSKTLSPGLRIGFVVAKKEIIKEARAIRTILLRHPPTVLQETIAIFLALGYYDRHLRNIVRRHGERWQRMKAAIDNKLGGFSVRGSVGGTSFWLTGPDDFDATEFSTLLKAKGVIVDKGETFFIRGKPKNSFRLGFGYLDDQKIEKGVELVAQTAAELYGI